MNVEQVLDFADRLAANPAQTKMQEWRPRRDSNPRYHRERIAVPIHI
jgi:hypothetical protein